MRRLPWLLLLSVPACEGIPTAEVCEDLPLPDVVPTACEDDLDGDGVFNCDDDDVDGDGLRNGWDCHPGDPTVVVAPAGGLCGDGDLDVTDEVELGALAPSSLLVGAVSPGDVLVPVLAPDRFVEGDQILILTQQGPGAGTYEWVMVASSSEAGLVVEPYVLNAYDGDQDLVLVQRVPQLDDVEVSGWLNTPAWSARSGGGVLMFRACGTVDVIGDVSADGAGFAGGEGVSGNDSSPYTGESWAGPAELSTAAESLPSEYGDVEDYEYPIGDNFYGGGGAPVTADVANLQDQLAGGGGGSYATEGEPGLGNDGELLALFGETYGVEDLTAWHLGSGGGAGGADNEEDDGDDAENVSGDGGAGGGIIAIFAYDSMTISGVLTAEGAGGEDGVSLKGEVGGGGGGSGGQILLAAREMSLGGDVSVAGGNGGWPASNGETVENRDARGGRGGYGYVRVDTDSDLDTSGVDAGGVFRGSADEWCWEVEPAFEPPCETDADGDGVLAWACGGEDCDDTDATVHPGVDDATIDGVDRDCDGVDGCEAVEWTAGGKTPGCSSTGGSGGGLAAGLGALGLIALAWRRDASSRGRGA